MLELYRPLLFIFTISATFLFSIPNICAAEVWISTSHGVYKLGEEKPVYQKVFKGQQLTAFKTEILPDNWAITAWGEGRKPVATENNDVAYLEMINLSDLNERIELVKIKGKRIRDFVVDDNKVVAVGHFNGNVHFISLDTKEQKVIHLSDYDEAIIHAIEKADLDKNGVNEYYVTVTSPNVAGGLGQEGLVVRLDIDWRSMKIKTHTVINLFNEYSSYAREIAIADIDNNGSNELIVEVSPQIEIYGEGKNEYNEPMRLIAVNYNNSGYQFKVIAEANVRLGRTLSYDDIDSDKINELYFADYYMSGLYVVEQNKEKTKANGINVNQLKNEYLLTQALMTNNGEKYDAYTEKLMSNHALLSTTRNELILISDSVPSLQKSLGLRLVNFNIRRNSESYDFVAGKTVNINPSGFAWHMFVKDP